MAHHCPGHSVNKFQCIFHLTNSTPVFLEKNSNDFYCKCLHKTVNFYYCFGSRNHGLNKSSIYKEALTSFDFSSSLVVVLQKNTLYKQPSFLNYFLLKKNKALHLKKKNYLIPFSQRCFVEIKFGRNWSSSTNLRI